MVNHFAIVVGGGSGTRMQSKIPKQFMLLNGLPVLMHTITAFAKNHSNPVVILVLNELYSEYWDKLCKQYKYTVPHTIIYGGKTRFDSVRNGLSYINDTFSEVDYSYIAIHDGVRPLISQQLINDGYMQLANHQALVTAISSKDSVRVKEKNNETSTAVDRDTVFLVQTPQFFHGKILLKAYEQKYHEHFTDDASVVESAGYSVKIISGDSRNIKITFSEDLLLAEVLIKSSLSSPSYYSE